MKTVSRFGWAFGLCLGFAATSRAGVATFDDLPSPPTLDGSEGLSFANNNSSVYDGVTWDSRLAVVGDQYRIDTTTPGPLYGIPHSGDYFITNSGQGPDNDGILITTNQVLLGAWFGQNEYYGFGSGATQVTIYALGGTTQLGSVVFNLPAPALSGQPGVMGFADTSSFASLAGITGYQINRIATNDTFGGNWTADDFTFASAVPEPSSVSLVMLGLMALGRSRWNAARRCNAC